MTVAKNLKLSNSICGRSGFTLIEIVVVVTILALAAAIVLPLLPSTAAGSLRTSARRLATVIRYLGDRSVTTKSHYRMHLDMGENAIGVKKIVDGEETTPEDPFFSRRILEEGVTIEDIEVPRLGKTSEGVVDIDFGVAGLADFAVIHLKGANEEHFTVTALPYGGKVEVVEGYREMKP